MPAEVAVRLVSCHTLSPEDIGLPGGCVAARVMLEGHEYSITIVRDEGPIAPREAILAARGATGHMEHLFHAEPSVGRIVNAEEFDRGDGGLQ